MQAKKDGLPQQPANDLYLAAKSAYESAQADFSARKRPLLARRVLERIWGSTTDEAVEVLAQEIDALLEAMSRFEQATNERCRYSTATMAAVVAHYYGPSYILDTNWPREIAPMAEIEAKLDVELGLAEVDALRGAMIDAKDEAEAEAQIPEEEAV